MIDCDLIDRNLSQRLLESGLFLLALAELLTEALLFALERLKLIQLFGNLRLLLLQLILLSD